MVGSVRPAAAEGFSGWMDKARVPSIYIATRILVRGIWSLRFLSDGREIKDRKTK